MLYLLKVFDERLEILKRLHEGTSERFQSLYPKPPGKTMYAGSLLEIKSVEIGAAPLSRGSHNI
jgi:hypothetical protein